MMRFFLKRPVAVLLSFVAWCILGLLALHVLPISLLPDADVPQIVVKVNYPNTAAEMMESRIIRPLRESLSGIPGLRGLESRSNNHRGVLYLVFEYNTKMDLAYIEVNERIDRLSALFPKDMPRPQTTRVNTSDIPIVRLQVIPRLEENIVQVSELAENLVKRRLEQLEGVSVVDINGARQYSFEVEPRKDLLQALQIREEYIAQAIQAVTRDFGGMSIRDGNYQYFVKVSNGFESSAAIGRTPVRTESGFSVPLEKIAGIRRAMAPPSGYHLFNGRPCIGITIQKQAHSRMNELVPEIQSLVKQFAKDYPEAEFILTQDQTFLLNAGIDNLKQDLVYGAVLAVLVLFLFLGNYASSILMSINIPLSLIITFALFYALDISLNIISLSGLALGIGMLIDNSIIVLDNITRKRNSGLDALSSCEKGVGEVVAPVLSQVFTTVAVYAPLILLPGLAGLLVSDQAIALSISLGVSLLVAFVLSPVLYHLFLKNQSRHIREDTRFYRWVLNGYHRWIQLVFRNKALFFSLSVLFALSAVWLFSQIPVSSLPKMEKKEGLLKIDWQAPISLSENLSRMQALDRVLATLAPVREAEVGVQQFLLQTEDQSPQQAQVYYACSTQKDKEDLNHRVQQWFRAFYPEANVQFGDAGNAFSQLLNTRQPFFEVKLRTNEGSFQGGGYSGLLSGWSSFPYPNAQLGLGAVYEPGIRLMIDVEKMTLYGVEWQVIQEKFRRLFGHYPLAQLDKFSKAQQVYFHSDQRTMEDLLRESAPGREGNEVKLSAFVDYRLDEAPKCITADKSGPYLSLLLDQNTPALEEARDKILRWANDQGLQVRFGGVFFEGRRNTLSLLRIFIISVLLLYFILALQFENLLQPILVMLTIPLGVSGALLLLYLQDGSLDLMAAIGFIVVLGIIVDEPILKVEVINRLLKQYEAGGMDRKPALERAIADAGDICLKPLLMTSLTTSLALVPVLFTPGIGAELQRSMVYVVIGGLTIGTFFTIWFIPLTYWMITKKK